MNPKYTCCGFLCLWPLRHSNLPRWTIADRPMYFERLPNLTNGMCTYRSHTSIVKSTNPCVPRVHDGILDYQHGWLQCWETAMYLTLPPSFLLSQYIKLRYFSRFSFPGHLIVLNIHKLTPLLRPLHLISSSIKVHLSFYIMSHQNTSSLVDLHLQQLFCVPLLIRA